MFSLFLLNKQVELILKCNFKKGGSHHMGPTFENKQEKIQKTPTKNNLYASLLHFTMNTIMFKNLTFQLTQKVE